MAAATDTLSYAAIEVPSCLSVLYGHLLDGHCLHLIQRLSLGAVERIIRLIQSRAGATLVQVSRTTQDDVALQSLAAWSPVVRLLGAILYRLVQRVGQPWQKCLTMGEEAANLVPIAAYPTKRMRPMLQRLLTQRVALASKIYTDLTRLGFRLGVPTMRGRALIQAQTAQLVGQIRLAKRYLDTVTTPYLWRPADRRASRVRLFHTLLVSITPDLLADLLLLADTLAGRWIPSHLRTHDIGRRLDGEPAGTARARLWTRFWILLQQCLLLLGRAVKWVVRQAVATFVPTLNALGHLFPSLQYLLSGMFLLGLPYPTFSFFFLALCYGKPGPSPAGLPTAGRTSGGGNCAPLPLVLSRSTTASSHFPVTAPIPGWLTLSIWRYRPRIIKLAGITLIMVGVFQLWTVRRALVRLFGLCSEGMRGLLYSLATLTGRYHRVGSGETNGAPAATDPSLATGSADAPTTSYSCPICLSAISYPAVTTCGHVYCWPCILQFLKTSASFRHTQLGSGLTSECPVCRNPFLLHDLLLLNYNLRQGSQST